MKQVSGLDATFLFTETARAPNHVSTLSIFDPSTAPDGPVTFERIVQTITERAHLAPHTRQRLVEVPFNADFPYWVRDESFDVTYHVRHISLPKPGDWQQLCTQVARLHERVLDRSRPLWELYIIEGLGDIDGIPPGCIATFSKIHHAAVDGAAINSIASMAFDPTPETRKVEDTEEWEADAPPTPFELSAKAIQNNLMRPLRYYEYLQKQASIWTRVLQATTTGALSPPSPAPRTRFNNVVSPHRVFDGATFSLEKIKAVKNSMGGTVNDVVLAICAGAMREYLLEKDELPEQSLVSMCPINVRDGSAPESSGNQVVSMSVELHTDMSDPKDRLQAISTSTSNAKEYTNAVDVKSMLEMWEFIPMELGVMGSRVAAEQGLANFMTPTFNAVITNVPGSPVPFYSNGAVHVRNWGLGPIVDGNGLFHAVSSYCADLTIGVTCCRNMMPDPEHYADLLRKSFEELAAATLGD